MIAPTYNIATVSVMQAQPKPVISALVRHQQLQLSQLHVIFHTYCRVSTHSIDFVLPLSCRGGAPAARDGAMASD